MEKHNLDKYVKIKIMNVDNEKNAAVEDTTELESNVQVDDIDGEVTVSYPTGDEVLTEKVEEIGSGFIREHKGAVPKTSSGTRRGRRLDMKKDIDVGEDPIEGSKVVSNPVKIHEPKNHKSTRTWSDSKDLALGVSLGQDPLDILNIESTKTSAKPISITTVKGDQDSSGHAANQFLNEVKHTTQATVEDFKKSIKPIILAHGKTTAMLCRATAACPLEDKAAKPRCFNYSGEHRATSRGCPKVPKRKAPAQSPKGSRPPVTNINHSAILTGDLQSEAVGIEVNT
nr:unnamed protein product [Callosobruchus chinensis]